jgi:methyl coenzyme M reductase subunit C
MKHYRQIIINIEVEDDLPEQKLDELVDKVKATVEENTDNKEIQLDGVRVN